MCVTDLDLEIAADEQLTSPDPDPDPVGGRYAGVAWGLAKGHEHHEHHDDQAAAGPAEAGAEAAGPAEAAGSR
jgi:hypothetical protein